MSATRDGRSVLVARCRQQFLDALSGFARDRGFRQPEWLDGLVGEAGNAFDELAGLKDRQGFETARSLTASRISLVHERDLEFSIVLTDVARRVRERCEHELARLHVRMMRLLDQRDTTSEQCPVGPEAACRGLRGLAEAASLDAEVRLKLLSDNAEELAHVLRLLYRTLDRQLEDAGLKVATRPQPGRGAETRGPSVGAPGHGTGAMATLRHRLLPAGSQADAGGAAVELPPDLLRLIYQWLDEHCDVAHEKFSGSQLAGLLSPQRSAAVLAVEQVFDAIAADRALAAGLRAALGRLRLPLLKLALKDDSLFSFAEHPANRLMQAMATACAGIDAATPDESPWLARVCGIADELRQGGDDIGRALTLAVGATESLIDERMQAMHEATQPATEAALRSERHELCLAAASRALRALLADDTPDAVRDFLELYWVQVLARTAYTKGEKSPEHEQFLRTAAELLDSVGPGQGPALLKRLPELIKRMQAGVDLLGLEQARRNAAMAPCMDLHSALVRNAPRPAYRRAKAVGLRLRPVPGIAGARLLMHGGHSARDAVAPKWLQALEVGDWLYVNAAELGAWHGCTGWIGPHGQIAILVAADGRDLLLITRRALAELAERDAAHLLQVPSPLEAAARRLVAGG